MRRILLSSRLAALLAVSPLVAGCADAGAIGRIDLELYDAEVSCALDGSGCYLLPDGLAARGERHRLPAIFSRAASRHDGGGIFIHVEIPRSQGVVALLELDLPTALSASTTATRPPEVTYLETTGERIVFSASTAIGRAEVPARPDCPCQDGRIELVFTDPGPDGQPGTDDDAVRRISRGRFTRGQPCRTQQTLPVEDRLEVIGLQGCPAASNLPPPAGESSETSWSPPEVGCDGEPIAAVYEEDVGCGGDPADEGAYETEGGCDGSGTSDYEYDYSGCEWDSGAGEAGCDGGGGDYGGGYGESGGCDGDEAAAACEAEAHAAAAQPRGSKRPSSRARERARLLGMLLPLSLLGVLSAALRRHHRRGRGRSSGRRGRLLARAKQHRQPPPQ